MSDLAEIKAINNLEKISGKNEDIAIDIIDQSIINGWAGLFELRRSFNKQEDDKPQSKPGA